MTKLVRVSLALMVLLVWVAASLESLDRSKPDDRSISAVVTDGDVLRMPLTSSAAIQSDSADSGGADRGPASDTGDSGDKGGDKSGEKGDKSKDNGY